MSNPVLPPRFNLGSYIGEQIAPSLAEGIHSGYEQSVIQNAFNELNSDASPYERWQKFTSLPVRQQTKQHGMKALEKMLKNQPTIEKAYESINSFVKNNEQLKEQWESLPLEEQYALARDATQRGGGFEGANSSLQNYLRSGAVPGYSSPAPEPTLDRESSGYLAKDRSNTDRIMLALRNSTAGKLFGLNDPEKIQALSQSNPEAANDWISNNLGPLAFDIPLFALASRAAGPFAAMASVPAIAEGAARTWELARKKAKGEEITPKDYEEAASDALKEGLKGGLWAKVAQFGPLARLLNRSPGFKNAATNTFAQGAARLADSALVAPELATLAIDHAPQKSESRLRNLLLGLGFEALGNRGPVASRQGQAPEAAPPGQIEYIPPNNQQQQAPPGPSGAPTPDFVQAMTANARNGADAFSALRTAERVRGVQLPERGRPDHLGLDAEEGSGVNLGSEAQGDVSVPLAPQVQEYPGSLARTQDIQVARPSIQAAQARAEASSIGQMNGSPASQSAPLRAQANRVNQNVVTPQFRQPQSRELDPLLQEAAFVRMRGERPFLPQGEERLPSPREQTETTQARENKAADLKSRLSSLRDEIKKLNKLQEQKRYATSEKQASLDNEISKLRQSIEDQKKIARRLQKEIQTGREKLSDQQIEEAVARRRSKMIENAAAQNPATPKEIARKTANKSKLQQKLAQAKAAMKQKQHLPEDYRDSFTRVKQRYIDEFSRIRNSAEKEMKGDSPESPEYKTNKRIYEEADEIVREAEADLALHKQKRGQEYKAEQDKINSQQKERDKTSNKIEKLTPKKLKNFKTALEAWQKRPIRQNLEKVASQAGISPKQVEQASKQAKAEGKKLAERIVKKLKINSSPNQSQNTKSSNEQSQSNQKSNEQPKKNSGSGVDEALKQTQNQSNSQQNGKQTGWRGSIKKDFSELFSAIKNGNLKGIWANRLGKALIIQGLVIGFDEASQALGAPKYPIAQLISSAFPGLRIYRTVISGTYNIARITGKAIASNSRINSYNETFKTKNINKRRELDKKLTPKEKKKAKQKRVNK